MAEGFTETDLAILLAMPRGKTTVERFLSAFVYVHRDAPPCYDSFREFIAKGGEAGFVSINAGKICLEPQIWKLVHDAEVSVNHDWTNLVRLVLPQLNAIERCGAPGECAFGMSQTEYENIADSASNFDRATYWRLGSLIIILGCLTVWLLKVTFG